MACFTGLPTILMIPGPPRSIHLRPEPASDRTKAVGRRDRAAEWHSGKKNVSPCCLVTARPRDDGGAGALAVRSSALRAMRGTFAAGTFRTPPPRPCGTNVLAAISHIRSLAWRRRLCL